MVIPPAGITPSTATSGAFAVAWSSFVAFWTVAAFTGGGLLFAAFSIPFWGAGFALARQTVDGALLAEKLEIGRSDWSLMKVGLVDWSACS